MNTNSSTTELITPEQVAELLKVHPGTLENWRVRGEGPPFVKLGNSRRSPVRYPRKAVEDWIYADMKRDGAGRRS